MEGGVAKSVILAIRYVSRINERIISLVTSFLVTHPAIYLVKVSLKKPITSPMAEPALSA